MGKEQAVVVFVVMMVVVVAAALCPALSSGVVIEQASEAAAKTAEEGLGNIARQAINKANKILNGSSQCKTCSVSDLPYFIFISFLAYFASAYYYV